MENYAFKISAHEEFLCTSESPLFAQVKATAFVVQRGLCREEFSWVPSTDGPRVYRMAIGS